MRFSKFFIPTTKEVPSDASLPSHQYLLRGGFVASEGAGLYNYMPLGNIVLNKIKQIVKQELDNAGCNEVTLSMVTPYYLWEQSNRSAKMGKEMLRFKDRKNNDFVLSPTNEEAMVNLVKNRVTSYRNLPLNLYQINTKFRDEARPRFGLLRAREFVMKDGYSFHSSYEDMKREFSLMEETYKKIFNKLGLDFRVVEADSGAIGGSGSKEFHVLANSGEDTIVVCNSCDYGANIETAIRKPKQKTIKNKTTKEKINTPNIKTIDELSKFFNLPKNRFLKTVVKKAIYEDKDELVAFFINGDDELETTKATNAVGALELIDTSDEELKNANLVAGFIGIENLNIPFVVDSELKDEIDLICGANEKDYHIKGINLSEYEVIYKDIIKVQQGDLCAKCGEKLSYTKGIEVGHIFQLGEVYSKALEAYFLDENGKQKPYVMGTYGIGVSRLISAIIEQNHDERGCIWTKESAPFLVDIIVSNGKKEQEQNIALEIYKELKKCGIETILDDRVKERFGFKMSDFELIGVPFGVIVGKKISENIVEIVNRKTLQKEEVKIDEVVNMLKLKIDKL
jgi:prolyl-tRNA synthetase